MKKNKKAQSKNNSCAERDRLWKAFLAAGKDWQLVQAKMAKDLRRAGQIDLAVKKIEAIKERIDESHKMFATHIESHGCWSPILDTTKTTKKPIGKGK